MLQRQAAACTRSGYIARLTPVLRFDSILNKERVAHVVVSHNVLNREEMHTVKRHRTIVRLVNSTTLDVGTMHLR